MKTNNNQLKNEHGFVLIVSLLILLILTLIGIAATNNTSFELQISGNDKVRKTTFYKAEAGAVLGTELIELSLSCITGFSSNTLTGTNIHVSDLKLWDNSLMSASTAKANLNDPTNKYDAAYPYTGGMLPSQEVGFIYFGGETTIQLGGSLEMVAGYEGKGKSSAQGGVAKTYDIYSQFRGVTNSESIILLGWRHLIGTEGSCGIY